MTSPVSEQVAHDAQLGAAVLALHARGDEDGVARLLHDAGRRHVHLAAVVGGLLGALDAVFGESIRTPDALVALSGVAEQIALTSATPYGKDNPTS